MERKQKIEQEVQKTLEQFDRAERLRPNPFFYTRVRARIDERERAKRWSFLAGVLKPAFLVLLVVFNTITAAFFLRDKATESMDRRELVMAFAQELGLETRETDLFVIE